MDRTLIRKSISEMFICCPPDMADKVEKMLFLGASTYEEYADPATLFERVVWYVKTKDYASRVRKYGVPYSCGFFHDDTAYVNHVRARFNTPWDPELLAEREVFIMAFMEAYHGNRLDASHMWLAWVKAAFC